MRRLAPLAVLALVGCHPVRDDDGSWCFIGCAGVGPRTRDTSEPRGPRREFDPRADMQVRWDGPEKPDGLVVTIEDDASGFYLGMVETPVGPEGWTGEDCLFAECHHFMALNAELTSVSTADEFLPGTTTRYDGGADGAFDAFDAYGHDRLTYLMQLEGGSHDASCFIWGADVSYFEGEGCAAF
jgi:hypothetical protein